MGSLVKYRIQIEVNEKMDPGLSRCAPFNLAVQPTQSGSVWPSVKLCADQTDLKGSYSFGVSQNRTVPLFN